MSAGRRGRANLDEEGTKHWRGLSRRFNRRIGSGSSKLGLVLEEKILKGLSARSRFDKMKMSGGTSKLCVVGARGFEPPTPASRTQCATGLRYAPTKSTEPQSERGLSYIRGSKRKLWASATSRQVILPPDRFTPFASPASARRASSTP